MLERDDSTSIQESARVFKVLNVSDGTAQYEVGGTLRRHPRTPEFGLRPMQKNISPEGSLEAVSLQLLRESRQELATTLNSLGGKSGQGLYEHYLFYSSGYINHAAAGFIALRDQGMIDASKLMVRPVMELMFRQCAVCRRPELLYRMAFTDWKEDRKWMRPAYVRRGRDYDSTDERNWGRFKREYTKAYPRHNRKEAKLTLFEVAQAAGLESYYNSHYRLYCRYTHGAFAVMAGPLRDLSDSEDNRTVAAGVIHALGKLKQEIHADIPRLEELRNRLFTLTA